MSVPSLPTELWLEIGYFVLLFDPQHISLSSLSQTCRLLHTIFSSWTEEYMLEQLGSSQIIARVAPFHSNPSHIDGPWLKNRFKYLKLSLRGHDSFATIRCVRYLLDTDSVAEVLVDHSGEEVDFAVLACFWTACVQGAPSVTLKEYSPYTYSRARLEEGSAFQLVLTPQNPIPTPPSPSRLAGLARWFSSFRMKPAMVSPALAPSPKLNGVLKPREPLFTVQLPSRPLVLTHFYLSTPESFTASMYPWTMHVLNNAPIIDLYLDVRLSVLHWGHILPLIYIPTLKHFAVGYIPIAIPDLLKFFDRHNALTSIDLTCSGLIGPLAMPSIYNNTSFLPALQILIAPPEYTLLFLKHRQLGFLPQLTAFHLMPWKYDSATGSGLTSKKGERAHRDQFFTPIFECLAAGGSNRSKRIRLKLYPMALISFIEWTLSTHSHGHESPHFGNIDTIQAVYAADLLSSPLVEELKSWMVQRRPVVPPKGLEPHSAAIDDSEDELMLVHTLFCIACPNHAASTANYCDTWISLPKHKIVRV